MSGTWWLIRTLKSADDHHKPTYAVARRIESGVELVMSGTRRVISVESARAIFEKVRVWHGEIPEDNFSRGISTSVHSDEAN